MITMDARTVDGVAIVSDEPTASPITDRSGKRVYWQQIRTLTLADGRTVYGCAHCDYVREDPKNVRPHLNMHSTRVRNGTGASNLTVHELLGQLAALEELRADRDKWRARALKAERALGTLRSVLGGRA